MKSYKSHLIMQKTKWYCALIQKTFMKMEMMTITVTELCTILRKCPIPHIKSNTDPTAPPQHVGQDSNVSHILHI